MADFFAGSEILEMAIQIEKNGRDFYEEVSRKARNPVVADMFSFLAKEEEKHIAAFKTVCEKVDGCGSTEAEGDDYLAYMNALASEHVFTQEKRGFNEAMTVTDERHALDKAIVFEKDSIVFYEGMRAYTPESEVPIVESLIAQEKAHLLKLITMKQQLQGQQKG